MSHPLERQIGHTRRHARRLLLRYGLAWTIAIVVSVVVVLGLADFVLRFEDRGIRLMSSLAVLTALLAAGYRFAFRPLRRRMSNVEIAQSIERRFPQLGERLSSAIDFLGRGEDDPGAGSALLRRSVIHETQQAMADLPVDETLDRRPTRRALAAAAVVLVATLAIVAASPRAAALAALRLAKPFGDDRWPRENNLDFRSAPSRLAVGDLFEADLVDASGLLPEAVRIYYRYDTANGPSESVETVRPQGNHFTVQKKEVDRPFAYRAEGGDDHQMPWHAVEVIETPRVETLKIMVTPPAYTGWPAQASESQIQALRGSKLEFTGAATKPLKAIAWRQDNRVMAGIVAEDRLSFRVPSQDNPLLVEGSGWYHFELTDAEGLVGGKGERWEIRAVIDQPPSVNIEEPAANLFVTAKANVPIKIAAKDDLAIHEIALHTSGSSHADSGEVRTELYRGPEHHPPAVAAGEAAGERGDSHTINYSLDLAALDLKPGATVTFFASADDYLPQRGQSTLRKLTILSPREFEDRIAQRQSLIHGEITRALKLQQETRIQTEALEIQAREVGKLGKADLDRAQAAEMNQRRVKRTLSGERDGVQASIKELFAELENNRVDSPDLKRQMQEMFDELGRLGEQQLGPIEHDLTSAVKDARSELAQSDAAEGTEKSPPEKQAGETAPGEKPSAEKPAGEKPQGEKPASEKAQGEKPSGEKQVSEKASGEKPAGEKPAGEKPPGEAPPGEKAATPIARELASAGAHQERVIESLEALLGRLSQWDNYRRFGREVAQLRQQQDELLASTRQTAGATLGKEWKDLDPQQQADLKKIANRQTDLARQLDKLEQQMADARERLSDEDPVASETLGDAVDQARQRAVSGAMRKAGESAQRNQVSQAVEAQTRISQELDELQNILSNRREQELDRLVRKLKEAERSLEELRKRQAGLRSKLNDLAKQAPAAGAEAQAERKKELERLTREERELQKDAQRLARRLERLQADRAGQKLARAAGRMGKSGEAGDTGAADEAGAAADQAQKDLDEAQQQLAQRRREAEADLAQEQMARIEDSIKSLRERQGRVRGEALRYAETLKAKGRFTRGESSGVQTLGRQEKGLSAETTALAEKVSAAEVFNLALTTVSGLMDEAAALLHQREVGAPTQEALASAERRLDRILGALAENKKQGDGAKKGQNEEKAGGGGEGQGQKNRQNGIRSIAELRLLQSMQEDLLERYRAIGANGGLSPAQRAERLEQLAAEEGRLAELTLKLSKPEPDDFDNDLEKLPDVRTPPGEGENPGEPAEEMPDAKPAEAAKNAAGQERETKPDSKEPQP